MLLQTNSYLVPEARLGEHRRLMRKMAACFARLGLGGDQPGRFDIFEQVGPEFTNRSSGSAGIRCIQMMRFADREQQQRVQKAEAEDAEARQIVDTLCRLVDLPGQQKRGLFANGFYVNAELATSEEAEPVDVA
jgi:hypothetical protein